MVDARKSTMGEALNLLPCPFCGDESPTVYGDNAKPDDGYRLVRCTGLRCGIETGWHSTETEAVNAWNTRPASEAPAPVGEPVAWPDLEAVLLLDAPVRAAAEAICGMRWKSLSEASQDLWEQEARKGLAAAARSVEPWVALSCEQQYRLATTIAANIGYELVPEPEHPDSPHAAAAPAPVVITDAMVERAARKMRLMAWHPRPDADWDDDEKVHPDNKDLWRSQARKILEAAFTAPGDEIQKGQEAIPGPTIIDHSGSRDGLTEDVERITLGLRDALDGNVTFVRRSPTPDGAEAVHSQAEGDGATSLAKGEEG